MLAALFKPFSPALEKEIGDAFKRADQERDSAEVRRHKQWMAEQEAKADNDNTKADTLTLSEKLQERALAQDERKLDAKLRAAERDLRLIALELAIDSPRLATAEETLRRASAYLEFLKGEAAA